MTPSDDPELVAAAETFARCGAALADALEADLAAWLTQLTAGRADSELASPIAEVAQRVNTELRALLASDIDGQRATPLQVIRQGMAPLTSALVAAGATPAPGVTATPEDPLGLGPHAFADISDTVGEAGLAWGCSQGVATPPTPRSPLIAVVTPR